MNTPEHRTLNLTAEEFCDYCEQGADGSGPVEWVWNREHTKRYREGPGLVIVSYREAPTGYRTPEYGPCPHCEAGFAAEQAEWTRGYWQGRPADLARPRPLADTPRLSRDVQRTAEFLDIPAGRRVDLTVRENLMRTRLLMLRYAGRDDIDPSVGIDIGSGERRRALVERELAKATP